MRPTPPQSRIGGAAQERRIPPDTHLQNDDRDERKGEEQELEA